ncbi:MAG: glycosyltransferase family 2 protein [Bacteroidota bacterium]
MRVSVIVPVYNGEKSIEKLAEELLASSGFNLLEVIFVNDGSRDNSEKIIEQLSARNEKVKFISLRKNFGEHNAVMCGLNFMSGDAAVIMDDDGQNPPSEITKLVNEAEKGFDVVYAQYDEKKHSASRNFAGRMNDKLANRLLKKPKGLYLNSFKLIRKEVVDEIIRYTGPAPYIDGLIFRTTENIGKAATDHAPRDSGKSNYTIGKLISLCFNMFFNFSILPLRILTVTGFVAFVTGLILSVYFIINKIIHPDEVVGWTSTIVAILVFSGAQLIFLGLIGEYTGKQFFYQNQTPQWVIKKKKI